MTKVELRFYLHTYSYCIKYYTFVNSLKFVKGLCMYLSVNYRVATPCWIWVIFGRSGGEREVGLGEEKIQTNSKRQATLTCASRQVAIRLTSCRNRKRTRGDKGGVVIIAMMGNGYIQIVPCVVEKNREERGRGIEKLREWQNHK